MSLILSGSDGVSDIDGTAATPAIRGTDTNTGIFFGSDIIGFSEGGVESMRIDSSGNLGLGTTSPGTHLEISGATSSQLRIGNTDTTASTAVSMLFLTADDGTARNRAVISSSSDGSNSGYLSFSTRLSGSIAEKMRIDSSGNVGIGTTGYGTYATTRKNISLGEGATISAATSGGDPYITIASNAYFSSTPDWKYVASDFASSYEQYNGTHVWSNAASGTAGNTITFSERMRIDSSGNLLVGTSSGTGAYVDISNTVNTNRPSLFVDATAATATNQQGITVRLNGDPNNTTNFFLRCFGGGTERAQIRSNGGLANFSANNVNLSDERTKKDIVDAGNYLNKICAIPVRTFLYKDQTDEQLNLGVIAQEVEKIAPELVSNDGFGEIPEDGTPLKAIYQTDLQYALMKCIQEQQAIIENLTTRLTALENK
jgi:hypothetical protein